MGIKQNDEERKIAKIKSITMKIYCFGEYFSKQKMGLNKTRLKIENTVLVNDEEKYSDASHG